MLESKIIENGTQDHFPGLYQWASLDGLQLKNEEHRVNAHTLKKLESNNN